MVNENTKSIFITGGAGYIGSHIAELLLKNNKKIFIIDNLSTGYKKLISKISQYFSTNEKMNISDFKIMTKTSRKNAIPLLEFLDKMKITEREGDMRIKGEACA